MSDGNGGSRHSSWTSRRSFLGSLASGPLLANTVRGDRKGTVRLPTHLRGGEVVRYRDFPRDWYDNFEAGRKATRNVTDNFGGIQGVESVAMEASDVQIGDLSGFQVRVRVANQEAKEAIPEQVNGVPVRTEKAPVSKPAGCPNRGYYDPLPGGIAVYSDSLRGSCTTAVSYQGDTYMMSASHVWGECDVDIAADAYIDGRSDKIGVIYAYDESQDFVLIDDSANEVSYANKVREEYDGGSSNYRDFVGYVSEHQVGYLVSGTYTARKSGSTTGYSEGEYIAMYKSDTSSNCVDFEGHGVEGDYFGAQGDSGAPVYSVDDEGAWMVNMFQWIYGDNGSHRCGGTIGETCAGTAAYHMNDTWGIGFDV